MRRILLSILLLSPASVRAQLPPIAAGTRVRVESDNQSTVTGTLMSQGADSLDIADVNAARSVVRTPPIRRVAFSEGRTHSAGAKRGALVGSLVGAGVALVMLVGDSSRTRADYTRTSNGASLPPAVSLALISCLGGAMDGAIIGALIRREQWKTVYKRPAYMMVAPVAHNGGIGVSINFRSP